MNAYPEAKVVLVNRDFDAWFPSFAHSVVTSGLWTPFTNIIPYFEPLLDYCCLTYNRKLVLGYFNAKTPEEVLANAKGVYQRHYREIREHCASTGTPLLEMWIEEGWEPLAKFLGKDVPDEPFPFLNDKAEQQAVAKGHRTGALVKGAGLALLYVMSPMVVLGVAMWWSDWL
ncbi:hypothetical protein Slin15195_G087460 [Septoria linicola]|uniref:Uncharacterized protein n=1 Tax=Septoria linicola TaxID=215465 RepID=A0A9Q9EMD8_9PEZI|nr:hypothetical protein Slin14017_G090050 [Septoria linicola]USW55427.1 hypothetical protein Slin15195_G087460 [Septoria linicola]